MKKWQIPPLFLKKDDCLPAWVTDSGSFHSGDICTREIPVNARHTRQMRILDTIEVCTGCKNQPCLFSLIPIRAPTGRNWGMIHREYVMPIAA